MPLPLPQKRDRLRKLYRPMGSNPQSIRSTEERPTIQSRSQHDCGDFRVQSARYAAVIMSCLTSGAVSPAVTFAASNMSKTR